MVPVRPLAMLMHRSFEMHACPQVRVGAQLCGPFPAGFRVATGQEVERRVVAAQQGENRHATLTSRHLAVPTHTSRT